MKFPAMEVSFAGSRNSDIGKRVEKARNAMKKCIDDAGLSPDDIDLIKR